MAGRGLRLPGWPGAEPPLEEAAAWALQDGGLDVEAGGGMSMAFMHSLILLQLHQLFDPALNASRFYKPIYRGESVVCNFGRSI